MDFHSLNAAQRGLQGHRSAPDRPLHLPRPRSGLRPASAASFSAARGRQKCLALLDGVPPCAPWPRTGACPPPPGASTSPWWLRGRAEDDESLANMCILGPLLLTPPATRGGQSGPAVAGPGLRPPRRGLARSQTFHSPGVCPRCQGWTGKAAWAPEVQGRRCCRPVARSSRLDSADTQPRPDPRPPPRHGAGPAAPASCLSTARPDAGGCGWGAAEPRASAGARLSLRACG